MFLLFLGSGTRRWWEGGRVGGSCVGGEVLQILDCKEIDCGVVLGWGMGWGTDLV